MQAQESVSPVHVGRALESLRNSNFNSVSAIGEVIDNSIEANSSNIRIQVDTEEIKGWKKLDLVEISFGDDGDGMNQETLHRCLQLGFSTSYNNRKGIGRFGVGMTLGAITQCTRIEVYSKPKGGQWNFTCLDLNEIKDQPNPIIPEPKISEVPKKYADLIAEKGTLVIWKNLDREDATIEEIEHWIGRTYRKFIGEEIIDGDKVVKNPNRRRVFLNDREVSAFDPLYVTKTAYNSEVGEFDPPIIFEEEIHEFDSPPDKLHGASKIVVRLSLLPEKWRYKKGIGDSPENKKRFVHMNEGISILRNDREVFYGHIPYYHLKDRIGGRGFIDLDRYWGCEISFNAELDHWFSVKNIKVGAKPITELREKIEDAINDTIHEYRKEIRKVWEKYKTQQTLETGGAVSRVDEAEDVLKKNAPEPKKSPDETENDINEILKKAGESKQVIATLKQKMSEQPFTFLKSDKIDRRGPFIDIASRGDRTLITLNINHPFFQKVFSTLEKIEELKSGKKDDDIIVDLTKNLETSLLLLIGTFTAAQKEFNPEHTDSAHNFIQKLMHNWTFHLEKNAETLKDV